MEKNPLAAVLKVDGRGADVEAKGTHQKAPAFIWGELMVAWDGYSEDVEKWVSSGYILKGKQKESVNGCGCGVGEKQESRMTKQLEKQSSY